MKQSSSFSIRCILFYSILTVLAVGLVNGQDLKSRQQGNSLVQLNGTFDVPSTNDGNAASENPLSAVVADINGDGINDLIIGRSSGISIQLGDINAFAPETQSAWEAIRDLRYISPFLSETRSIGLAISVDFVQTGDFTRDGQPDIITASRSSNELVLLEGDGKGNFSAPHVISVGGNVTAFTVGDVNRLDGFADVLVGVGSEVLIYQGLGDISKVDPIRVSLPNTVETIAVGQLDMNSFTDIAVGNGNQISIVSGSDDKNEVSNLSQNFSVKSLIVGEFVPDRAYRPEIAALDESGTVHILSRGDLDTRSVSQHEQRAMEVRKMLADNLFVPKRILKQLSREDLAEPGKLVESDSQMWSEYDQIFGAVPSSLVASNAVLTSGRLSNYGEDLIVLDAANNEINVMPLVIGDGTGEKVSYAGKRQAVKFSLENSPVVAITGRFNFDGEKDLLVLQNGKSEASTIVSAPQASFTVNNSGDQVDANPGNGVCATAGAVCTLRAAIMEANKLAGNDSITINSGVNITLSTGNPDNDANGNFNTETGGDLDITCVDAGGVCATPLATNVNNLTITGAVGGNTINGGTSFTPFAPLTNTTDRVFDIGMDSTFGGGFGGGTAVSVTMSNLTIQGGNVREDQNTANGGFGNTARGGAMRVDGNGQNGTVGTLTLTSVTLNNNQADWNTGGVFNQFAGVAITSVTATNNIGKAGPGGALSFGASPPANLSVLSSNFSGNEARSGSINVGIPPSTLITDVDGGAIAAGLSTNTGTITNTNFTNNISQDDGGALRVFNGAVTVSGTSSFTGNTARDDGGAIWGDHDTVGASRFLTLSGLTINSNTANSDTSGGGDGGAIFRDRGVMNVTNCIIGTVTLPNTANNGGGIAHAFRAGASATNVTTINVDNGSISGNNARKTTGSGEGGAMFVNGTNFNVGNPSTLNIGATTAVTVDENNANIHGSGISLTGGTTGNLTRGTFSGNDADADANGSGDGGGLYHNNSGGTTTIASTVSFTNNGNGTNTTENGGAIHHSNGTLTLNGPSISGNNASVQGGGLFVSGGAVNVNGLTFSANTFPANAAEVRLTGGTTNFTGTNTIPGELSIAGGTLLAGSSTVNLGEDFNFSSGTFTAGTSLFNFNNASTAQQVYGGSVPTFINVTVSNTAGALIANNNTNVNGTLTVNTNAILQPAAASIIGGSGTLTGSGVAQVTRTAATADFLSQYTIANKILTNLLIDYVGASAQTVSALTYGGLRLNNASGATLAGSTTVNGPLALTNGILATGAATLTVGGTGTSARTNGYVSGNLSKIFTSTGSFLFPVGTASGYSPFTPNVTTLTTNPSTLRATAVGTRNTNPSTPLDVINRYWDLTLTGALTADLTFQYLETDLPIGNIESGYTAIRDNGTIFRFPIDCSGSPAVGTACVNAATNIITVKGVSTFSQWFAGRVLGPTSANASIAGRVVTADGRGISRVRVSVTDQDGNIRTAISSSFGFYLIDELPAGQSYVVAAQNKRFTFAPRSITLNESIAGFDITAEP